MFSRRKVLLGGSAALALPACTTFNTETGEKYSCDIVAYNFNTGLMHGSPAFDPSFIDDGNTMSKWKSNNESLSASGDHHDQPTVVVGVSHNGEPALPNTKWIKAPNQFQSGDSVLFSYCFCVDNEKENISSYLSEQTVIQELHVKSSHFLHRVLLNGAVLYGGTSGVKEFVYTRNSSDDAYFVDGLNCLHIHLINDDPYPIPTDAAISVSGYASGVSCCN